MMASLHASAVTLLVLFLMTIGSTEAPSVTELRTQGTSWTLMVYMADDTSSPLNWQDDLNEMETAQQAPGTSVIALVDPQGLNNSVLYKVTHDPNIQDPTIVSTILNDSGDVIVGGEVNMAEATTLADFIEFSTESYPAENYVLILWGHGAGWRGLCPDGTDVLNLTELGDALHQTTTTMGRQIDLVAVDSCAEASLETMYQIHPYVRLFLASEKDVPFQGLPYAAVMDDLVAEPSQSVEMFASSIANDYVQWSASNTDYSVTMGVFNMSRIWRLVNDLGMLSIMGTKYDPIFNQVLRTTLNNSERYEEAFAVDFKNFAWLLQSADLPLEIRYSAYQCVLHVENVVEYFQKYDNPNPVNGVHVQNASGFTVFAPGAGSSDASYANISLAITPWYGFGRLLRNNTLTVPNGPGPAVSYESLETDNDSALLTWPDGTQYGSAWVFKNQSSGLTLEVALNSSDHVMRIKDMPGRLTLATSSYLNGSMNSYRTVNLTLHGTVIINVGVIRDDMLVTTDYDKYEVSLVTGGGEDPIPSKQTPTTIHSPYFDVRIPEDAEIGDVVVVQVIEKSTGELVGEKRFVVPLEQAYVEVEVTSHCECPYRVLVPLAFALLPGLLILAFALSLHHENRKRRKDD